MMPRGDRRSPVRSRSPVHSRLSVSPHDWADTVRPQAISQKDDSIRGAEEAIQTAVANKSKTADAYAAIVRDCAPHSVERARQGYHL